MIDAVEHIRPQDMSFRHGDVVKIPIFHAQYADLFHRQAARRFNHTLRKDGAKRLAFLRNDVASMVLLEYTLPMIRIAACVVGISVAGSA